LNKKIKLLTIIKKGLKEISKNKEKRKEKRKKISKKDKYLKKK
jgi:hypothetical protein